MDALIVDALATGRGIRVSTKDVIGAGPRTIAGILEKFGFNVKIMEVENFLKSTFKKTRFELGLISGMTNDLQAVSLVASKWRKTGSEPIIIGGPVCSDPFKVLKKTRGDIAVIGEAEITLEELLKHGLKEGKIPSEDVLFNIKGIAFQKNNNVQVNSYRPIVPREVYRLGTPSTRVIKDYDLFHASRVYVEVLRGCSNFFRATIGELGERCIKCGKCFNGTLSERYDCPVGIPPGCGYCSVPSLFGPPKSRSPESIKNEVENLIKQGVHRIVLSAPGFLDYGREELVLPDPLTNPRFPEPNYKALDILLSNLHGISDVAEGKVSISIENIKASLVNDKSAKILGSYFPGGTVNIGFESGSSEHCKLLGRPDGVKETLMALQLLKKEGMKPYVYFIHGLPGQTEITVDETIETISKSSKYGAERLIIYRFQSLPMSAFSGFPSGPPAIKNKLSMRIVKAVKTENSKTKKNLIGSRYKTIVAEPYYRDPKYLVCYPMLHGPVTLVKGDSSLVGRIIEVKVERILSNRMVEGRFLSLSFKERV